MCAHACTCTCGMYVCGGQRTTFRSHISPSTMLSGEQTRIIRINKSLYPLSRATSPSSLYTMAPSLFSQDKVSPSSGCCHRVPLLTGFPNVAPATIRPSVYGQSPQSLPRLCLTHCWSQDSARANRKREGKEETEKKLWWWRRVLERELKCALTRVTPQYGS